jgi:hypothetical protein
MAAGIVRRSPRFPEASRAVLQHPCRAVLRARAIESIDRVAIRVAATLNFLRITGKIAPGDWGIFRLGVKLNNAVAATAIAAFLRLLRRRGRNPDRWEAEQIVRAMAFLKNEQYRKAIDHVGKARLPPSKRDPVAVREIEKAAAGRMTPSRAVLQTVLDEICDDTG